MRAIAITAAAVVGWFVAMLALLVFEAASGVVVGSAGALIPIAAAIGLAVLVARLVPRSARTQARQQQRLEKIVGYRRG
jgi:hypothetical protein